MRLRIQRYGASRGVEYGFSRSLTRKRLDVSLKNVRRAWTCCPASAAFARRSRSDPEGTRRLRRRRSEVRFGEVAAGLEQQHVEPSLRQLLDGDAATRS